MIFHVVMGVKGQKRVPNDKKFCLPRSISQDSNIILSFTVQMCKMIISPRICINSNFLFSALSGEWKTKKWTKMTKTSVCRVIYFRNHISFDLHLCYKCVKGLYLQVFFSFLKILIFWIIKGVKGQKMAQSLTKKSVCLTLYLRNRTSYDCDFWCTYVK